MSGIFWIEGLEGRRYSLDVRLFRIRTYRNECSRWQRVNNVEQAACLPIKSDWQTTSDCWRWMNVLCCQQHSRIWEICSKKENVNGTTTLRKLCAYSHIFVPGDLCLKTMLESKTTESACSTSDKKPFLSFMNKVRDSRDAGDWLFLAAERWLEQGKTRMAYNITQAWLNDWMSGFKGAFRRSCTCLAVPGRRIFLTTKHVHGGSDGPPKVSLHVLKTSNEWSFSTWVLLKN